MAEHTHSKTDLLSDLRLLVDAVTEAGEIARTFFQGEFAQWQKKPGDPVTEADIAVNQHLEKRLTQDRPDYGWLSEETEDDKARLNKERVWVVDPIDGTRAFVKGKPHFTICAALVEKNRPICATILNPITEDMYEAHLGGGAKHNNNPMSTTTHPTIENCRMLGHKEMFKSKKWDPPWPNMEIEARNSIALRMGLVATGEWDACVALNGKSDWDLAAGDLIVHEAGGQTTDHRGNPFLYNREDIWHPSVIAAGPPLHAQLVNRLKNLNPKKT